jgi:hypothetical protein
MNNGFGTDFKKYKNDICAIIDRFDNSGEILVKGKRNSIRTVAFEGITLNIKSFKIPILINRFIYGYVRKSKARRSFEFAQKLLSLGIGTPMPIAWFEHKTLLGLADSYYVSEHLKADLTFKELVSFPDFPDHENILRQFTAFCFLLHEKGVEFLDHSPGNTLIKKDGTKCAFFLVDLNRMKFHDLSFEQRMKNLSRLTPKKEMVGIMANEYAALSGIPEQEVFNSLWQFTSDFQQRFQRKKQLKKKFKFGK